jgi:phosphotransferase system HPr (HPr) family protein
MLVHAAKEFDSDVLIRKLGADGAKEADGKRLISIMSLGARRGDTITFFINGPDEENAARRIREVCRENIL